MARLIVALLVFAHFTSAILSSVPPVDDANVDLLWERDVTQGPAVEEWVKQDNYPEMTPPVAVEDQAMDAEYITDQGVDGYQDEIQRRISGLDERLRALENSNDDLRMKLKTQQLKTDEKIMNIDRFVSEREDLVNQTLQNLLSEEDGCRPKAKKVAFSAYLSRDLNHLGRKQTVRFDRTTLNYGRGYCASTGIFTAPRRGIYVFSFFVGQRGHNQIFVELVVNGADKSDAAVETTTCWQDAQGGNVVVLGLKRYDRVYIRKNTWGSHIEGSSSIRLSTFSGFLLYRL